MSLTFLLRRMAEDIDISSAIGLFMYVSAFEPSPGLKGVREHRVRHTLVTYHLVVSGVSLPQRRAQTASEPALCNSCYIILGLSLVNIPAIG